MDSANVLSRCFAVAAEERQRLHSVVQWLTIPNVSYEYSCGRNGGAMVFLLSVSRDQFVFFFNIYLLPVTKPVSFTRDLQYWYFMKRGF